MPQLKLHSQVAAGSFLEIFLSVSDARADKDDQWFLACEASKKCKPPGKMYTQCIAGFFSE